MNMTGIFQELCNLLVKFFMDIHLSDSLFNNTIMLWKTNHGVWNGTLSILEKYKHFINKINDN